MTQLPGALACLLLAGQAALADPMASRVLLLDNQQVLTGEIERVGEQYRVRRDGGETFVPVTRAQFVCSDLSAAYEHLRGKVAANDVDARLRLARWCDVNGLRREAAAEAKLAADLAPGRAIVQATYRQLQRKADAPVVSAAPALLPASILSGPTEPADCSPDAYKRFATKVQPVLMNTCAACHAGTYGGKFRLERAYADGARTRPATQRNLASALAAIDRSKPASSALLNQALTPHGGAPLPPLRDRGAPAFKQLEEWVRMIVSDATEVTAIPAVAAAVAPATGAPDSTSQFGAEGEKKNAGPADPFDPEIFNRQHHPAPRPTDAPSPGTASASPSAPAPGPGPR